MVAGEKEWAEDDGMRRLDLICSPFGDESPPQGQIISWQESQSGKQTKGMSVPKIKGVNQAATFGGRSGGDKKQWPYARKHDGQDEQKEVGQGLHFSGGRKRVKVGG